MLQPDSMAHAQKFWLALTEAGRKATAIIALLLAWLSCVPVPAQAQALQPHSGPLVVGSEQEYPPCATGMSDATANRLRLDLWRAVAAESGLNDTIVVHPLPRLRQQFKDGKIDGPINLAQSDERRQYVDFTAPHVVVPDAILVRKGETTLQSGRDLAGKFLIVLVALLVIMGGYFLHRSRAKRQQAQAAIAAAMDLLKTIIDTAPVRVFWKDKNLCYLGCNAAFARDAGMAHPDQLIGKDDHQMGWAAQAEIYRADDRAVIASGNARLCFEERQNTPDGRSIWLYTSKVPLRNHRQEIIGLLGIYEDITERKRLENERAQALDRLSKIASRVPGVVFQYLLRADGRSCFPFASDAMHDLFRLSPEQVRLDASALLAVIHPDDIAGVIASLHLSARTLTIWHHGFRVKFDDGTVRWLLANALPQREPEGAVLWHGFATDNTEHKRAEAIFRGLFDQSIFIAGILDCDGRLIEINNAALNLVGATREQVIGQHFPDTPWWFDEQDRHTLIEVLAGAYAGRPGNFEASHPNTGGAPINVMFSAMPIALEDAMLVAVVGVDITERKRLEDQVRQLAFHDTLTRLPNRRLLNDRLAQAMANSKRNHCHGALMFVDLDNFKSLNDTRGHDAGDLLLLDVAERLGNCVRETDTVARIGGDEFIVMLGDLDVDKAISAELAAGVAEKIRIALAAPYFLKIKHDKKTPQTIGHRCSASIGVVLFNDHEASQEDILKWADAAMYRAKDDGRNRVRMHCPDA